MTAMSPYSLTPRRFVKFAERFAAGDAAGASAPRTSSETTAMRILRDGIHRRIGARDWAASTSGTDALESGRSMDRPGASALHDQRGELGRHLGRARDVPGAAHDDGPARLGHEDRARLPVPRGGRVLDSTRRCGHMPARPAPATPIRHRGRAPPGARAVPRARRRLRRRSARASPRPPPRAAGPRRRAPRCRRRRRRAPGRRRTARPPAGRTRPTPGSRRAPAGRWPSPTPGAGARRPACRRCRR